MHVDSDCPTLVTESEAAQELRLSPATLRKWRHEGRGPLYFRIGGAVRYRVADLDAFIERGACDPETTADDEQ